MKEEFVPAPFLVRQADQPGNASARWAIKQGARWRYAEELCVQVTVLSILDPSDGPCLSGVGVVRCLTRGRMVITA